jgi:phosphatidylglycerol:prolipoprotein diacylglycerol transferase
MKPQLFGVTSYFVLWVVGAACGVWAATNLSRRAGLPTRQSFVGACALACTILVGSKVLFLIEHWVLPVDAPTLWGQEQFPELLRYGFRIPGGILLMAPVLPLLCRRLHLPTLRFADAVLPAVGLALVFIRVGCLLNGCCFGAVTDLPLAMTFPPTARVYEWQVGHGLIAASAPHTLPVHPLQLYFVLHGLALCLLGLWWQRRKSFDGQVWINFYLVFFGGTFFLEFLRPQPLRLNLLLAAVVVAMTALLERRQRHARLVTVPAS